MAVIFFGLGTSATVAGEKAMKKLVTPAEQLENRVRDWITSSRGKKAIKETLEKSDKATKKLQQDRRVDPVSLDRPFTV